MFCLLSQATLPVKDISFSHFLTRLSWCDFGYWITWFSSIWMVNYIIGFYVYMTTSVNTLVFFWVNPTTSGMPAISIIAIITYCLPCWVCITCQPSWALFTLLGALKESRFVLLGQGCKTLSRRHHWIWSQQQLFIGSIPESATPKRWYVHKGVVRFPRTTLMKPACTVFSTLGPHLVRRSENYRLSQW